jgi:coenzyme F420-reducing hydrogenase delta subunit
MTETKSIVVFCCENSGAKAAAAVADRSVLEGVDVVSLPCAGKVEVGLVLKCFEKGHPAVLVVGCPIDNCKYLRGNCRAQKRVEVAQRALRDAGLDEKRIRMELLSSVDTHKLEAVVREMKSVV